MSDRVLRRCHPVSSLNRSTLGKGWSDLSTWIRNGQREFIRFDIHEPDNYEVLGYTMNAVLGCMMISFRIDDEIEFAEVVKIANLLEFPAPEMLLESAEKTYENAESLEEFHEWARQYCLNH